MIRVKYIICMLLFCTLSLSAQNISVASFNLDESDLTANLHGTTVLDQNGEKCALIRIQTTQTGFSFDVGSLGVSKVVPKTGEIWVYVPFGVKRITLRHQQLGTTDYVFPIKVEKARTYRMQLTTGEVQTIVKNAVTSQYVLFRVTPKNAVIELDGEMIETVGGTATKRMPFGSYSYRVQAPRHAPEVGRIEVNDPKNKHIVNVNLVPQFAKVPFTADEGVEIWIDDRQMGIGSCSVELGYGTYLVECRKAGHRPSQQEVVITKESGLQPIVLKSPMPIYGSLDVNSSPADAEVWVGGKQVGTTPLFISEFLIGSHEVTLKKQGYKELALTVNVTEGQTASVMQTMEEGIEAEAKQNTAQSYEGGNYADAVDLGLSVKWASCNVGATKPEEYGGYYAWGETEEKSDYSWETYKWCKGTDDSMTKYCTKSKYGTVDNKTTLDPADDVARVKWGGKWRMPTFDEIMELRKKCKWEWTTLNGVEGRKVTGPNGNSIFLPAAGFRGGTEVIYRGSLGFYWSCSLSIYYSYYANGLYFRSYGNYGWNYSDRYDGHPVRPVSE